MFPYDILLHAGFGALLQERKETSQEHYRYCTITVAFVVDS
jgi:hypothetical protein